MVVLDNFDALIFAAIARTRKRGLESNLNWRREKDIINPVHEMKVFIDKRES
jgi:hypothetical protein